PRIEAVREELHGTDVGEARIREDRLRNRIAECGTQENSVVDRDAEIVDREGDVIPWGEGEPCTQVHGRLFLQRLGPKDARGLVVHREVAHLNELPANDVRGRMTEEAL